MVARARLLRPGQGGGGAARAARKESRLRHVSARFARILGVFPRPGGGVGTFWVQRAVEDLGGDPGSYDHPTSDRKVGGRVPPKASREIPLRQRDFSCPTDA